MSSRALKACRRPRARIAIIDAIAVACFVANEQAWAEPAATPVIAASSV